MLLRHWHVKPADLRAEHCLYRPVNENLKYPDFIVVKVGLKYPQYHHLNLFHLFIDAVSTFMHLPKEFHTTSICARQRLDCGCTYIFNISGPEMNELYGIWVELIHSYIFIPGNSPFLHSFVPLAAEKSDDLMPERIIPLRCPKPVKIRMQWFPESSHNEWFVCISNGMPKYNFFNKLFIWNTLLAH